MSISSLSLPKLHYLMISWHWENTASAVVLKWFYSHCWIKIAELPQKGTFERFLKREQVWMWQSERLCASPEFSFLLPMHIKQGVGWLSVEPAVESSKPGLWEDHRCLFLKRREGARHQLVCTLRPSGMWSGPWFDAHIPDTRMKREGQSLSA